jgi:hypothetical protein
MDRLQQIMMKELHSPRRGPALYHELGVLLMRTGREPEGLSWFYKAILVDRHYRPTHQFLADYFQRTGNTQRAREHRQMLETPP